MSLVADLIGQPVSILTCDSRHIVGVLRGCDQHTNIVLEKCHERMYTDEGVVQQPIGVYIIKGDNLYATVVLHSFSTLIAVHIAHIALGELDTEADSQINLTEVQGETMPPLAH